MIRKLILFFALLVSFPNVFAFADTPPTTSSTSSESSEIDLVNNSHDNKTHRKPAFIPVHAYFTPETRMISIECLDNYEGEVFLIRDGVTIDYSPMINTTFNLPEYNGLYTIIIESETWTARGSVSL